MLPIFVGMYLIFLGFSTADSTCLGADTRGDAGDASAHHTLKVFFHET